MWPGNEAVKNRHSDHGKWRKAAAQRNRWSLCHQYFKSINDWVMTSHWQDAKCVLRYLKGTPKTFGAERSRQPSYVDAIIIGSRVFKTEDHTPGIFTQWESFLGNQENRCLQRLILTVCQPARCTPTGKERRNWLTTFCITQAQNIFPRVITLWEKLSVRLRDRDIDPGSKTEPLQ